METVYPTPEKPNTRMRLLREDDAPTYSAAPKRKHVTMTDDEIVDSVCATCGMAAAGLYWQMERLVNKDGEWQISVSELADKFNTDVRRIQESMAKLVAHGWVVRIEQQNRFGISVKNVWRLPHHGHNVNVQGASGGAGSARLGVRANPLQAAPLNVDTVDTVDTVNPLSGIDAKKTSRQKLTQVPEDLEQLIPKDVWANIGREQGMSDAKLKRETQKLINYFQGSGKPKANWVAVWKNWMQSEYQKPEGTLNGEHPNAARIGKWVG